MSYPVAAAPFPAGSSNPATPYSGSFIPSIWSTNLLVKFYASTVLAEIANTDYEGEIKGHGDKVTIRQRPTIEIRDYQVGQSLQVQRPSAPTVELNIDKGKYFNTILDDVIRHQSDINLMSMWADDASSQMKVAVDTDVLLGIKDRADPANRGSNAGKKTGDINLGKTGTPVALVARNAANGNVEIVDFFTRMGEVLDQQNIPEEGRYVVAPVWFCQMIKRSELRNAALSGDEQSMLRNGRLGMIDRFMIYSSNLIPMGVDAGLAAGESLIYFGHKVALTFATQFTQTETLKSESTFGELVRGLQVYGYNVLKPEALGQAVVTKGV